MVEPWLYGHNTGISPIAVSATRRLLRRLKTSINACWPGEASEVVDQAEQFLKTNSLSDYYDEVALQALQMAQVDLRRGVLDEPRQER